MLLPVHSDSQNPVWYPARKLSSAHAACCSLLLLWLLSRCVTGAPSSALDNCFANVWWNLLHLGCYMKSKIFYEGDPGEWRPSNACHSTDNQIDLQYIKKRKCFNASNGWELFNRQTVTPNAHCSCSSALKVLEESICDNILLKTIILYIIVLYYIGHALLLKYLQWIFDNAPAFDKFDKLMQEII